MDLVHTLALHMKRFAGREVKRSASRAQGPEAETLRWCKKLFCFALASVLFASCGTQEKSLRCIRELNESSAQEESYQSLVDSLNMFINNHPERGSNDVEHVAGNNILINEERNRAIVTELHIFNSEDGSRNGYGTVHLAIRQADSGWSIIKCNAPNFHLSVSADRSPELLDSRTLEDYILEAFIDDGLMNKDGCTLNQHYIASRWAEQ